MSQEFINDRLQKTLMSSLNHDSLWNQFLKSISYEIFNMQNNYSLIKNNWNVYESNKDEIIRINNSFGYNPNLIINNTISMARLETESIPYRIKEKSTYNGYSLILKQINDLGEIFNYYHNGYKLIKAINYSTTIENLKNSNHYSPFKEIYPIKNFSTALSTNEMYLDYLVNGQKTYDEYEVRYFSLDQKFNPYWKLDTPYVKTPTSHLGLEKYPTLYYCTYSTSLGLGEESVNSYECSIQRPEDYIEKSMVIKINDIALSTTITSENNKEYFSDESGVLNQDSYFDLANNKVHLSFNEIPIDYEISISYNINLLMTSDYFYYFETGMNYNKRNTIVPHCGIFLTAEIAQGQGSDFYHNNEYGYTVPDLKLKACTASAYNRYINVREQSYLDLATDDEGQPTGKENYKLDSSVTWFLDSEITSDDSLFEKIKYIACGNKPLNLINQNYANLFNPNYLLFFYNLNSENNEDFINDISSNNIDCTIVGDLNKIEGIINKSLNFNGETYAYSSNSLAVSPSQIYCFGMWFNANKSVNYEEALFDSFITIKYDYNNEILNISSIEIDCSKNENHFLVLNFFEDSIQIFLDSNLILESSFYIEASSNPIYIGCLSSTDNCFYGVIDNLWLLNKKLTTDEINYIYTNKITIVSKMGNRLAYYPLYDDEKYEDDDYLLIQSYVKCRDVNNEIVSITDDNSETISSTTEFYPITPSYFSINYTDSLNKTIEIKSNEKGEFYKSDTNEIVMGDINFTNGSWNLSKNTIKSKSQEKIKSPTKTEYSKLYHIEIETPYSSTWYTSYNSSTDEYYNEITFDELVTTETSSKSTLLVYTEDNDSSKKPIYYGDNGESYYIKKDGVDYVINCYIVTTNDSETHLFSIDSGKSYYLSISDLINSTNQIKAYVDLGESTGTILYSNDDGETMYLNPSCSKSKKITKWEGDGAAVGYIIEEYPDIIYSNLSFTSTVTLENQEKIDFNKMQVAIKSALSELQLTLIKSIDSYSTVYTIDYITSFSENVGLNLSLVQNSIYFHYWIEESSGFTKYTATVAEDGTVSGENILTGFFNYETNQLTVTYKSKINSDILVSYEYYDTLDINYSQPFVVNYKVDKSIMINEIGLEDENHELMAYMTFPNIEAHSIYNNVSAMFAIAK